MIGVALLSTSCRSGKGEPGPGPEPAAIRAVSGNQQSGIAGTSLTSLLSVVVTDKNGKPIADRRVDWDVSAGSGTVAPAVSSTNSSGTATTAWTLGTSAGTARVTARVSGLNPVVFTASVLPGAAASVVATPNAVFLEVGDTISVRAAVRDQYGNSLSNQAVSFSSLEPAIASVSATGLVSALTIGNARVVAAAGSRADTVSVAVGPPGFGVCGNREPKALAVGEVFIPTTASGASSTCILAPAGLTAEYAVTLISAAPDFGSAVSVDVLGIGTKTFVGPAVSESGRQAIVLPDQTILSATEDIEQTAQSARANAELKRRRNIVEQQELLPLVETARSWQKGVASIGAFNRANLTSVSVGDIIKLNVNTNQACSNADNRSGRVAAIGSRAIIVADNDNPSGGYSDAEYASVLATFDTLVFPMDTTAFGAPSNISQYGKIILFFTRAVNALTPANAGYTIGGFFFSRDLYPKVASGTKPACAASNENEMFYLLTPDPNGTVNGNKRSKEDVTLLNLTTITHELQHLINSSRRLYVNSSPVVAEETWLDEGLSHIAEELLYFKVSGFTSRQNLNLNTVAANQTRMDQFRNYISQNFSRFYNFLIAPEASSPYAPNDSLSTRGATWNFLRYAAGRQSENGEAAFFHALVNSRTAGVSNLQNVLSGSQFADYLRDWSVALIADDYSIATTAALNPAYTIPAWNFRSIYPGLRFGNGAALGVYPIATRTLRSNEPQRVRLAGGTSSYLRFSIPADSRALVTVSNGGASPPSTVKFTIVRMR